MRHTTTCNIAVLLGATAAAFAASGTPPPVPPCTDQSAACLQKIAGLYVDALRTHDGSKLPLASGVRRSENALTNARGSSEVRESFARTTMVEDTRDVRYYVDPARSEVVVFFVTDVDLKTKDAAATTKAGSTQYKVSVTVPQGKYTVHEAERFKIVRGEIEEIEIIAHVENGTGLGSGWPAARDPVVKSSEAGK